MHAYLIIGTDAGVINQKISSLTKKLRAKVIEFTLKKIEDTRALNSFTALKVKEPTAILINSIDEAGHEAVNAFLKNLEEPQENLYYILTAGSLGAVLSTVVSRCQIIATQNSNLKTQSEEVKGFYDLVIGQKLAYLDKIRDREEAIIFIEGFIKYYHELLHTGGGYKEKAEIIKSANQTLLALKANGNVTLQLANFVIKLDRG